MGHVTNRLLVYFQLGCFHKKKCTAYRHVPRTIQSQLLKPGLFFPVAICVTEQGHTSYLSVLRWRGKAPQAIKVPQKSLQHFSRRQKRTRGNKKVEAGSSFFSSSHKCGFCNKPPTHKTNHPTTYKCQVKKHRCITCFASSITPDFLYSHIFLSHTVPFDKGENKNKVLRQ